MSIIKQVKQERVETVDPFERFERREIRRGATMTADHIRIPEPNIHHRAGMTLPYRCQRLNGD